MTPNSKLLHAWQAGDAVAGARLLDGMRRRLLGYFARQMPHRAADLTSEVLLCVVEGHHRIRGDAPPITYAYTIARRVLAREIRNQIRESSYDEVGTTSYEPPVLSVELLQHLDLLDRFKREVVELHFFKGASGAEIARDLGVPEGTVRSRLRRAIIDLRCSYGQSKPSAHRVLGRD